MYPKPTFSNHGSEHDRPDCTRWKRYACSVPLRQIANNLHQEAELLGLGAPRELSLEEPASAFLAGQPARVEKRKFDQVAESSVSRPRSSKKVQLGVESLLEELESRLSTFLTHLGSPSYIPFWHSELKMRLASLTALKAPLDASILKNPAISLPYKTPDLSSVLLDHDKLKTEFGDFEDLRQQIVSQASNYLQEDTSNVDICLPFPEVIFLSKAFYTYALMRLNACHLQAAGDDDLKGAYTAAKRLFIKMRDCNAFIGDQGLEEVRKILIGLIPNDNKHSWHVMAIARDENKNILAYRDYERGCPLIIVDVDTKANGEAQAPFNAICKFLGSLAENNAIGPIQLKYGTPVLCVQLVGLYLVVGGAIYQTAKGGFFIRRLPGFVELTEDFGHNLQEAAYTFCALAKSLISLENELNMPDEPEPSKPFANAPRVGLEGGGISITESPDPGTIYKVRLNFSRPVGRPETVGDTMASLKNQGLSNKPHDTLYILKTTYPYMSMTYGGNVHKFLAQHRFAPALYQEFSPSSKPSFYRLKNVKSFGVQPIIRYHLMEFLPPPLTERSFGWVTLAEFAEANPSAVIYKAAIREALTYVIELLRSKDMVHGDMRPNNIMIRVRLQDSLLHPEYRDDLKLIDIRIIDFDWSGQAGKVQYPAIRNHEIDWPGQDGQAIQAEDDRLMVRSWMRTWPNETPAATDSSDSSSEDTSAPSDSLRKRHLQ